MFLLFPKLSESIFFAYPEEGKVLNLFYQLGLIFLMFLSGYNTDIKVDRSNVKTISLVFAGATLIPMAGSIPFMGLFRDGFIGKAGNELSYSMVFAIGVAITSIPVISKIFFDMGIMNTTFSNTVLTVSTFQDLCLWVLLNVATRIARSGEIELGEMIVIVLVICSPCGDITSYQTDKEQMEAGYFLYSKLCNASYDVRFPVYDRHQHHVFRFCRRVSYQGSLRYGRSH